MITVAAKTITVAMFEEAFPFVRAALPGVWMDGVSAALINLGEAKSGRVNEPQAFYSEVTISTLTSRSRQSALQSK